MNNKKNIFLIIVLFSKLIHAQTNLVPNLVTNTSFENGPGTPHCLPGDNAAAQGDRA